MKKKSIYLFIVTLFVFNFLSFRSANAFEINKDRFIATASIAFHRIGDFLSFFNETVIKKVRNDFCGNYFSLVSSGEWSGGEFRAKIGSKICTEKVAIKIDTSEKKSGQISPSVSTTSTSASKKLSESKLPEVLDQTNPVKEVEKSGPLVESTQVSSGKLNIQEIIFFTNMERSKNILPNLSENRVLDSVALDRVRDMFAKGYFEHNSPSGENASSLAKSFDYKYITVGENIAMGNFDSSESLVAAWMASEGHKKNILSANYSEIGVAAVESEYKGQKVWISAQIFAKPMTCIEPSQSDKTRVESLYASIEKMKTNADALLLEINKIDSSSNPNFYNAKVAEYNLLADSINSLIKEAKVIASSYNSGVVAFNECIKLK